MAKQRPAARLKRHRTARACTARAPRSAPGPAPGRPRPPQPGARSRPTAIDLLRGGRAVRARPRALQRHDYRGAGTSVRVGPAAVPRGKGAARARAALPEHLPAPGDAAGGRAADASTSACTPRRSPSTAASYDEAISHLRLVRDEDPDNDHALYMLAVAHAQRGEHAEAVAHLERAIALNPENRALARRDPDLEPLRDDEAFRAALEAPARRAAPPRPPPRRSGPRPAR